ncbi:uncharacterized protein LOC112269698 [Brachypodium distachyon]|nr:uncharacterized protein LOC112269698 [Brachypodium distachyon]|eukprot:XP_024312317.1 uncharacterized protein LOC112269698 [Brachypodium distachyon]
MREAFSAAIPETIEATGVACGASDLGLPARSGRTTREGGAQLRLGGDAVFVGISHVDFRRTILAIADLAERDEKVIEKIRQPGKIELPTGFSDLRARFSDLALAVIERRRRQPKLSIRMAFKKWHGWVLKKFSDDSTITDYDIDSIIAKREETTAKPNAKMKKFTKGAIKFNRYKRMCLSLFLCLLQHCVFRPHT